MKKIPYTVVVSASFFIFFIQSIITLLFTTLAIIFSYIKWMTALRISLSIWGILLFLVMGKWLHVTGKNNIEKGKNYILLVNHASLYDIPAIMVVFPRVSWLGREYLVRIPLFGHALKMNHYIPISRDLSLGVKKIINDSIAKSGHITIAIFPESTRTMDGRLQDFKRGFVHILKATELDILPVTLNGMYKLKPKTRKYLNPFIKLELKIHKPLKNNELKGKSVNEILFQTKNIIESAYIFQEG
ncbi:1-acyl-sn-glycerol-3-phosphate acyltransferase [candidate division KSB1 bacterium]|nr:1-acyl-sn-glycerol-3-phosphate acyltransferase [candidate division KSB1 bacterium]